MKRMAVLLTLVLMVMLVDGSAGSFAIESDSGGSLSWMAESPQVAGSSYLIESDQGGASSYVVESQLASGASFAIENREGGAGSFLFELLGGVGSGSCRYAQYSFLIH